MPGILSRATILLVGVYVHAATEDPASQPPSSSHLRAVRDKFSAGRKDVNLLSCTGLVGRCERLSGQALSVDNLQLTTNFKPMCEIESPESLQPPFGCEFHFKVDNIADGKEHLLRLRSRYPALLQYCDGENILSISGAPNTATTNKTKKVWPDKSFQLLYLQQEDDGISSRLRVDLDKLPLAYSKQSIPLPPCGDGGSGDGGSGDGGSGDGGSGDGGSGGGDTGGGGSGSGECRRDETPAGSGEPLRVAISFDGNLKDQDDWAAAPLAIALLQKGNVNVVHIDYNNHAGRADTEWISNMRTSVQGACSRFKGVCDAPGIVFDARKDINDKDLNADAVSHLAAQIDQSKGASPLWILLAGPAELIWRALRMSNPNKHKHVRILSHSVWNEQHTQGDLMSHNLASILKDFSTVKVTKIPDQNTELKRAKSDDAYKFLAQSGNGDFKWLYKRIKLATDRFDDPSDAGMALYLVTGRRCGTIQDVNNLLL